MAPERLAEEWDRVGLQVGDPGWPVRRAVLCIDLTQRVLDEAIAARAGLVVAYHPLVFDPLRAVTALDPKQRVVLRAIENRVAVYSPHTALDAAEGGVNDWLCDGLGEGERGPIRTAGGGGQYKLVTFVPRGDADRLRSALARAGAGVIGDYSQCSFGVVGEGTFWGNGSASPAVGRRGRLERVEELRVEMVCPAGRLSGVVAALREVHPYEEPAFDVYRLEAVSGGCQGQGRVVTLEKPITADKLVRLVKKRLGVKRVEVSLPAGVRAIKRVGVCAGSGGSLLKDAGEVDAFVTGEMRHHDVLAASDAGVAVVLAGHTQTERPYLKAYRQRIVAAGGRGVRWLVSKADNPPLRVR